MRPIYFGLWRIELVPVLGWGVTHRITHTTWAFAWLRVTRL